MQHPESEPQKGPHQLPLQHVAAVAAAGADVGRAAQRAVQRAAVQRTMALLASTRSGMATWAAAAPVVPDAAPAESVCPVVRSPESLSEHVAALAAVGPADVVLDLGCGDGRVVVNLARLTGPPRPRWPRAPSCLPSTQIMRPPPAAG